MLWTYLKRINKQLILNIKISLSALMVSLVCIGFTHAQPPIITADIQNSTDGSTSTKNPSHHKLPEESTMVELSKEELALWGINNGCLNSNLVQNFYVLNSHSAVFNLVGGKRVLMRFRGCKGIKENGFVHRATNNQFCAHTRSIRVLNTGDYCDLISVEPYPSDLD